MQNRYGLALITCRDPYSKMMQWYAGTDYTVMALFYPRGKDTHALVYNVYDNQTPYWLQDKLLSGEVTLHDEAKLDLNQVLTSRMVKSAIIYSFGEKASIPKDTHAPSHETIVKRFRNAILDAALNREVIRPLDVGYHTNLLKGLTSGFLAADETSGYNKINNILRLTFVEDVTSQDILRRRFKEERFLPAVTTLTTLTTEELSLSRGYCSYLSEAFIELLEEEAFATKVLRCRRSLIKASSSISALGTGLQALFDSHSNPDIHSVISSYNQVATSLRLPTLPTVCNKSPSLNIALIPLRQGTESIVALDIRALETLYRYLDTLQSTGYNHDYAQLMNAITSELYTRSTPV